METKFQTSFIPKAPVSYNASSTSTRKPLNFFMFIGVLVFLVSLAMGAGVFGWLSYLKNYETKLRKDLDDNSKKFQPQTIEKYAALDKRMSTAKSLINNHIAVSRIMKLLSQETIQTVSFSDFKYDLASDGNVKISMKGRAADYNSVAFQSEVFGSDKNLKGQIFSDLDKDEKQGGVIFSFTTNIDPTYLFYKKALTEKDGDVSDNTDNSLTDTGSTAENSVTAPDIKNDVSTSTATSTTNRTDNTSTTTNKTIKSSSKK